MAFKVEDGTGLADANSYATIAEVTAYFADRDVTKRDAWEDLDQEIQENALVRATDYIEQVFGAVFLGYPENPNPGVCQSLHFPARGIYNQKGEEINGKVPKEVKYAVSEYAHRIAVDSVNLQPDPIYNDVADPRVKRSKSKVGPIEEETEFHGVDTYGGNYVTIKRFPSADRWLRLYISRLPGRLQAYIRH